MLKKILFGVLTKNYGVSIENQLEHFELINSKDKFNSIILSVVAIGLSGFHLYTATFGTLLAHKQALVHLSLELFIAFLLFGFQKKEETYKPTILNWIFALVGPIILIYVFYNYSSLVYRVGTPTRIDVIAGLIYLIIVLEATRRVVGLPLVIIALFFLAHAVFGTYLPGIFGHRGIPLARLSDHMFMSTQGIFGTPLGVSASFIFIFVLFSAFLEITNGGQFFLDLALSLTGKKVGGPAKTAVVASAFMGTISGSSIANTVATGSFTIPLMIKSGYEKHYAGAVEAAASTGGQLMPPVMGAAAFIMVEYTGISYPHIMLGALIPSIVYFFGVYVSVHLEAKRLGLKGLPADYELPLFSVLIKQGGYLLLPIGLMVVMLIVGQTPMKAGSYAIALLVILGITFKNSSIRLLDILAALRKGAVSMVSVALACATAGVIAGAISLTGIGLTLAGFIETIAQGNLFIALLLTMLACLILGMGLPTVATYIVLITIVAPALTNLGVPLLAAHLFVFYYGVLADITPPVALAAYAGAGIAGANQLKTGIAATSIAIGGFLVPYIFIYSQELILSLDNGILFALMHAIIPFLTTLLGIVLLASGFIGFLIVTSRWYERLFSILVALMLVIPESITDIFGVTLFVLLVVIQSQRKKKIKEI